MASNEQILCLSIELECACKIEYHLPFSKGVYYYGIIEAFSGGKNRYRMLLLDCETGRFITDDTQRPLRVTLELEKIKSINLLYNLKYSQTKPSTEIAKRVLRINIDVLNKEKYLDYLLEFDGKVQIKKIELSQFFTDLTKPRDSMISYHKNVLSIIYHDKVIPVLSKKYRYNLQSTAYELSSFHHHEDPIIEKLLPERVQDLSSLQDLKKLIKTSLIFNEEPFDFMQKVTPKPSRINRVNAFKNVEFNRPVKAFFNQLSLKNLGRKGYYLPYLKSKPNIMENIIALSSLKHPITIVNISDQQFLDKLLRQVKLTSLLNNQTCLIVDPHQLTGSNNHYLGELALSFENPTNYSIFPKNLEKSEELIDFLPNDSKSTALQEMILESQTFSKDYSTFQAYYTHFQSQGMFHESILLKSHIDVMTQNSQVVLLKDFYKLLIDDEIIDKMLHNQHKKRIEKLNTKPYQKLHQIFFLETTDLIKNALLKAIKIPSQFHKIKQIFPIITVKGTEGIPSIQNTFDQVILIAPKPDNFLDFNYADKLTILNSESVSHNRFIAAQLPIKYQTTFDEILARYDHEGVNLFHYGKTHNKGHIYWHEVSDKGNSNPHESTTEAQEIKRFIKDDGVKAYDIRSAFVAQKKVLKDTLKHRVKTLHEPLTDQSAILSLAITNSMDKSTYDWLKNQPIIIENILYNRPMLMHIFLNRDAIFKHMTINDELYGLFRNYLLNYQAPFYSIDDLPWLLFKSLSQTMQGTIQKDTTLPKTFQLTGQKKVSYIIKNSKNTIVLMIILHSELHDESEIKKLLVGASDYHIDLVMINIKEVIQVNNFLKMLPTIKFIKNPSKE